MVVFEQQLLRPHLQNLHNKERHYVRTPCTHYKIEFVLIINQHGKHGSEEFGWTRAAACTPKARSAPDVTRRVGSGKLGRYH
jgi:hypothetical protein